MRRRAPLPRSSASRASLRVWIASWLACVLLSLAVSAAAFAQDAATTPALVPTAEPELPGPTQTPAQSEAEGDTAPTAPTELTPAEPALSTSALPWSIDVHAFVSQGFILTTDNDYFAKSKRGSVEFSEFGLNFTKSVTDQLRIGAQFFARDLGPAGNYRPQFDWFYLDYRLFDWLGLRAGRTKIPFGLYNEYNDIDSGRVPILLPQSMYPNENRDFLLAVTGAELYGYVPLSIAGQLEYRAYGGTLFIDSPGQVNPRARVTGLHVPYVFGGRLMWLTPVDGLQLGGSFQALKLETDYQFDAEFVSVLKAMNLVPAEFTGAVDNSFAVKLWVASLEYALQDLLISAEYGRWHGDSKYSALIPRLKPINERFYLMASYRVLPWFTPGVYYAGYFPNVKERTGRENYQHDFAATLRFDLMSHWLVKLESHLMRGTAGLDPNLNGVAERAELRKNWALFMIKTTAYF